MANDFMGYILAALTGTGQGVDQLQQRDRQRGLDAQKAQDDALQRQVTQAQLQAAQAKPTRRAVGTVEIAGPDGKPRLANRYEDGSIEPTEFSPFQKPEAARAPVPGTDEWKAMRQWEFGQQSAMQATADERRARLEAAKEARRVAQGGGAAGTATEGERRAAAQFVVAQRAQNILTQLDGPDGSGSPSAKDLVVAGVPLLRGKASAKAKQYDQAFDALAVAYLRATSGASFTESEKEAIVNSMKPRIGDDPETLKQKRGQREAYVQAIGQTAGRAVPSESQPQTQYRKTNPYAGRQ